MGEQIAFWVAGPLSVLAALGLVVSRKAVHGAMMLAVTMICLAVMYIAQNAPFLGIVQIVVYTGAVMMLFLFVLMLVGVDSADSLVETIRGQRWTSVLAAAAFGVLLLAGLGQVAYGQPKGLADATPQGNVPAIASLIFTRWIWAFELTSALLIVAALGAMVLAHRERLEHRPSQRDLSVQRFRTEAEIGAGLPPSGVYARHNAVDTPALLPDGSPSELSISRVLTARGETRPVSRYTEDVATLEGHEHALTTGPGEDRVEGERAAGDRDALDSRKEQP